MIIKKPSESDIPQFRVLWHEAFGDSDEFLDSFFETAFSTDRAMAVYDNDTVAAALYWFDCEFQGEKAAYIYAVATAKTYRGRGICHRLMDETHRKLQNDGYIGAILVPGEKSLFDFYGKMGYSQA